MNTVLRTLGLRAFALLLLTVTSRCWFRRRLRRGVYDPPGYVYGGWGRVSKSDRRVTEANFTRKPQHQSPPRAYRPAPQSHSAPSIPTRPRSH